MGRQGLRNGIFQRNSKWIQNIFNNLLALLNNKRIKEKIFYVYILCVLVPTIVTNVIILGSSLRMSVNERKTNINNIADSVSHDIAKSLESAVYVTVDLYTSASISDFLDRQYETDGDYYEKYSTVFSNYVFYASSKHLVSDITFYSDNSTMINGGKYYRIDSVKKEGWYKKFKNAGTDLFVYPYFQNNRNINNKKRMISVIRKLNYLGLKEREKLVKLDLNYNQINEAVNSSAFNTTVYVCHGNSIIFTNDREDEGLNTSFLNASLIKGKNVQAHRAFTAYGIDWDVYVTGYKSNFMVDIKHNLMLMLVLFLADALIPAFMLALFSNSITRRILLLGEYLEKVRNEKFELIAANEGKDEIGELLENYNHMTLRMKAFIENELKSKLEQQELVMARQQAELLALSSQINPHFLFNVLESIRMRSVLKGEEETSHMIESLARLMRKSADWGSDYITIEQETGFMRDYLELQKYRYGEDFRYKIKIEEKFHSFKLPSLVLVTFVENSCVHGLDRPGHYGSIFVSAYEREGYLYLEIEDTGIGMEKEQVEELEKLLNEAGIGELQKSAGKPAGLGMLNACIRLRKFCGEGTRIIIESEPGEGTCIIIRVPLEERDREM